METGKSQLLVGAVDIPGFQPTSNLTSCAHTTALPGYTIAALATASGTSFVDAALGIAAVLGNIAGPAAGIDGPAGDRIHPGINLITAGRDHAPWRRLEELLLEPVDACQRALRELSRAAGPDRLDHLQFSHVGDDTAHVAETSKAGLGALVGTPSYIDGRRHLAVLRTPTFFLRAPDGDTLIKAASEIMDGHASLCYEDLGPLMTKGAKHNFASQLAAAVVGRDEHAARDKAVGPGRFDAVRAHLLVTTTGEQIAEAMTNDALQVILRHSTIVVPESPSSAEMNLQNIRWGYTCFYRAIKGVLDARRGGHGAQIEVKPEIAAGLHTFTRELQAWCGQLPVHLQPFFSSTLSLPYRLHWAFLASVAPRETDGWVLPFTMAATREILKRQRDFLEQIITDAQGAEHRRTRIAMLWKLADKPLAMRDLVRRFRVQRLEVHEPVVRALRDDGLICQQPDGLLELTGAGRGYLAAA